MKSAEERRVLATQKDRAQVRREIAKHGHKGEPGYELLHPGNGPLKGGLKWDYAKFNGQDMKNSFVASGGGHTYKVLSDGAGKWRVVHDGNVSDQAFSSEVAAAEHANSLHSGKPSTPETSKPSLSIPDSGNDKLEWRSIMGGNIFAAGNTGMGGDVDADTKPLKGNQWYMAVTRYDGQEPNGKFSLAANHNSTDFHGPDGAFIEYPSLDAAKKAAEEHYANGGWQKKKNALTWSNGDHSLRQTKKLPNGQQYLVNEDQINPGKYSVTLLKPENGERGDIELQDFDTIKQAMDAAQVHASQYDIKLEDYSYDTNKNGSEAAKGANEITQQGFSGSKNKLDWSYKSGAYAIKANNPHGKGEYLISSIDTVRGDYYQLRMPDGTNEPHSSFFDAVKSAQEKVDVRKFWDDPRDDHALTLGSHDFTVFDNGKNTGTKKLHMRSDVPGAGDYTISGELGRGSYNVESPHKDSKLTGKIFENLMDAQHAAVNEDEAAHRDYLDNLGKFHSEYPWESTSPDGLSKRLMLNTAYELQITHSQYTGGFSLQKYDGKKFDVIAKYNNLQGAIDAGDQMKDDFIKYGVVIDSPHPLHISEDEIMHPTGGDNHFKAGTTWKVNTKGSSIEITIDKLVNGGKPEYVVRMGSYTNLESVDNLDGAKKIASTASKQAGELGMAFDSWQTDSKGDIIEAKSDLFLATKEPGGKYTLTSRSDDFGGKYRTLGSSLSTSDVNYETGTAMIHALPDGSQWAPKESTYTGNQIDSNYLYHNWHSTMWEYKANNNYVIQNNDGNWQLHKITYDEYGDVESNDPVEGVPSYPTLASATDAANDHIAELEAKNVEARRELYSQASQIEIPTHDTLPKFHDMGRAPDEHAMSHSPDGMKFLREFDELSLTNDRGGIKDRIAKRISSLMIEEINNDPELKASWNRLRGNDFDTSVNPQELYDYVDKLNRLWAGTSGDHDSRAIAVQVQAARTFNLEKQHVAGLDQDTVNEANHYLDSEGPLLDSFLKNTYRNTQMELIARGVPEQVPLYRGMRFDEEFAPDWIKDAQKGQKRRLGNTVMNPLTSWSADKSTSEGFAGSGHYSALMTAMVPRESIYASARTGQGCANEYEYVILGGRGVVYAKVWGSQVSIPPMRMSPDAPEWQKDWTGNPFEDGWAKKTINGVEYKIAQYDGTAELYNNKKGYVGQYLSVKDAQEAAHNLAAKEGPNLEESKYLD